MTLQEVPFVRPAARPAGKLRVFDSDRILVGGLVVLAIALRAPFLGRAYWIDEGISVGISSHHLGQIPTLLTRDGSPPLFYLLLHFWMLAFGTSELATHLLPLSFSLAAIPLAYWSGKELFGRRAARWAAALMATNPFLGWYSTETRMYPIVIVLAIVGITFAVRAVRRRETRDAVSAIAAFTLLLYIHNWGLYLTFVTVAVLGGLAWRRGDRRLAGQVAGAGAVTFALWLPWVPFFLDQASSTAAPWAVRPNIGNFFADQGSALGGTLNFAVAPLLAYGAWRTHRLRSESDSRTAGLLCAIGLMTGVVGFLGAQIEPSWAVRYLAVIVAPLLLAAAGALSSSYFGRVVLGSTCAALALWSAIGAVLPNPIFPFAKSNVAAVADTARPDLAPGDLVVVTQTEQLAVLAYYLPKGMIYATPTGLVTDPTVVDWRNIVSRLQHADPCMTIGPLIAHLPVGAHVLEINPVHKLGARGSAWHNAVTSQVASVDRLLATESTLVAIGSYAVDESPRPYSPVVGEVFRKTAGVGLCAGA
ncbi:MAG TPA: glycosyltransferase family 39 protein [Acidimicrobiales bacterium]|nr:glycosyltransferase family 39 protein [Acidimicrobiales bacterium]